MCALCHHAGRFDLHLCASQLLLPCQRARPCGHFRISRCHSPSARPCGWAPGGMATAVTPRSRGWRTTAGAARWPRLPRTRARPRAAAATAAGGADGPKSGGEVLKKVLRAHRPRRHTGKNGDVDAVGLESQAVSSYAEWTGATRAPFAVLFALGWLLAGVAYYTLRAPLLEWSGGGGGLFARLAAGVFQAVDAGLSVGSNRLAIAEPVDVVFTICFELVGAALLSTVLARYAANAAVEAAAGAAETLRRPVAVLARRSVALAVWVVVGAVFATASSNLPPHQALLSAFSAVSTAGWTSAPGAGGSGQLLASAVYTLVGVPLYLSCIAAASEVALARVVARRRAAVRTAVLDAAASWDGPDPRVITDAAVAETFLAYDTNGTGYLDLKEAQDALEELTGDADMAAAEAGYLMRELDAGQEGRVYIDEYATALSRFCKESNGKYELEMGSPQMRLLVRSGEARWENRQHAKPDKEQAASSAE